MPRMFPAQPPTVLVDAPQSVVLSTPAESLNKRAQAMVKAAVELAFTAGQLSEARLFRDRYTAGNDGGSPARRRMRTYIATLDRRFKSASRRLEQAGLAHHEGLAELPT